MNKIVQFFNNKRFRHGGLAILLTIAVIAVTVLVNVATTAADNAWGLSIDVTETSIFSISAQTENIIQELTQPVIIYAFYRGGQEDKAVAEMLSNYRRASDMIDVQYIDPYTNPTFSAQFLNASGNAISDGTLIVAKQDLSKYRSLDRSEMYTYVQDEATGSYSISTFIAEQRITNAIVFVTNENPLKAYFLQGHQEVATNLYPQEVFDYLSASNIESLSISANNLDLLNGEDLLIIAAPQSDITQEEMQQIKEFMEEKDGSVYYLFDAGNTTLANLESIFAYHGFQFNHDLIIEEEETNYFQSPINIVPRIVGHDSTAALSTANLKPVLSGAASINMPLFQDNTLITYELLRTYSSAFSRSEIGKADFARSGDEKSGEYIVSAAAAKSDGARDPDNLDAPPNLTGYRFMLTGSSKLITQAGSLAFAPNINMFVNSILWLLGSDDTVNIVGKSMTGNYLYFPNSVMIIVWAAIVAVIMPLIILCAGGVVWLKRRHL